MIPGTEVVDLRKRVCMGMHCRRGNLHAHSKLLMPFEASERGFATSRQCVIFACLRRMVIGGSSVLRVAKNGFDAWQSAELGAVNGRMTGPTCCFPSWGAPSSARFQHRAPGIRAPVHACLYMLVYGRDTGVVFP